eukprot:1102950-Amphidinium_carterae.1
METYLASMNLFEGALPADLGTIGIFAVHGQRHEGTVPGSMGRLKQEAACVSLGHGLKGTWPGIGASFHVLSFWGNSLEGHLPGMQVHDYSVVL